MTACDGQATADNVDAPDNPSSGTDFPPYSAIRSSILVNENESLVVLLENVLTRPQTDHWLQQFHKDLPWKVETDDFGPQSRPTCYFGDPDCVFCYVGLRLEPQPWKASGDGAKNKHCLSEVVQDLETLRTHVSYVCERIIGERGASSEKSNNEVDGAMKDIESAELNASPSSRPPLLTACLANVFPPGDGFIPWHYDEVRAHGPTNTVASLSLGGPRRFQLRKRQLPGPSQGESNPHQEVVFDDYLAPGSVLLMSGKTQEYYEHCLPLEDGNNDMENKAPLRISLTLRSVVPGYEQGQHMAATDQCCTSTPDYAKE